MGFCLVSNLWFSCPSLLRHEITGRHHQAKIYNILFLLKSLNSVLLIWDRIPCSPGWPPVLCKAKDDHLELLTLLPPPPTKCWDHRGMHGYARLQRTVLGVVLKSFPMELLQEKDKWQRKPRIRFLASWSNWGYQPWKPEFDLVTLEPRAFTQTPDGSSPVFMNKFGECFPHELFLVRCMLSLKWWWWGPTMDNQCFYPQVFPDAIFSLLSRLHPECHQITNKLLSSEKVIFCVFCVSHFWDLKP